MPHNTLDGLREEHRELHGLLAILERQLLSTHDGGSPDFEVMAELLDYLGDEPERHHHRLEARLLERLGERAPHLANAAGALNRERGRVVTAGRKLQRMVSEVLDGLMIPRQRLTRLGLRYVHGYQALIAREETAVFPALEQHLRASDWLELVTACHWRCGLTEVHPERSEYAVLRRRIVHEAGGLWPVGVDAAQRCPVCDGH